MLLVERNDFRADRSEVTEEAWTRYGIEVRCVGRFTVACPCPEQAVRKLALEDEEGRAVRGPGKGRPGKGHQCVAPGLPVKERTEKRQQRARGDAAMKRSHPSAPRHLTVVCASEVRMKRPQRARAS